MIFGDECGSPGSFYRQLHNFYGWRYWVNVQSFGTVCVAPFFSVFDWIKLKQDEFNSATLCEKLNTLDCRRDFGVFTKISINSVLVIKGFLFRIEWKARNYISSLRRQIKAPPASKVSSFFKIAIQEGLGMDTKHGNIIHGIVETKMVVDGKKRRIKKQTRWRRQQHLDFN